MKASPHRRVLSDSFLASLDQKRSTCWNILYNLWFLKSRLWSPSFQSWDRDFQWDDHLDRLYRWRGPSFFFLSRRRRFFLVMYQLDLGTRQWWNDRRCRIFGVGVDLGWRSRAYLRRRGSLEERRRFGWWFLMLL